MSSTVSLRPWISTLLLMKSTVRRILSRFIVPRPFFSVSGTTARRFTIASSSTIRPGSSALTYCTWIFAASSGLASASFQPRSAARMKPRHLGIFLQEVLGHADAVGVDVEAVVAEQQAFRLRVLHRAADA